MNECINWIGIDDHANKWTIAHYQGGEQTPTREFELEPTADGYRRLFGWAKQLGGAVRIVYEAGPCGYELYRRLQKSGLSCEVAAPSLTPQKPGDRVKTNRRDARKLGRLYRAGELTLIIVPDQKREGLRDLMRAREAVNKDVLRSRHQISKLILRYGHYYREGKAWTQRHWKWLKGITLDQAYSQEVLTEMILTLEQRLGQLGRLDGHVLEAAKQPEYAPYVEALSVLRGISTITAMTILSELGDLRRFSTAPQLMAAVGVVPGESSTGDHVHRLGITKTGNAHVRRVIVEAAWHYQRRPTAGLRVARRRKNQPQQRIDIAVKCDLRLHRRFTRLTSRNKRSTVAATAVARELLGFVWAIAHTMN